MSVKGERDDSDRLPGGVAFSRGDILDVPNEIWGLKNANSAFHPGVHWKEQNKSIFLSQGTDWKNISCHYRSCYIDIQPSSTNGLDKLTGFARRLDEIPRPMFEVFIPHIRGRLDAWEWRKFEEQLTQSGAESS